MSAGAVRRPRLPAVAVCGVVLAAALTACAGEPGPPPPGSSPPSGISVLPIETVSPQYGELAVDRSTVPVPTVPWQLVRVDRQENGIYLSASTNGCSHPKGVRVTESGSSIHITVTGTGDSEPCSMQYVTLIGYVQLDSLGDREVTGYTS
jgi:hypothetical protein